MKKIDTAQLLADQLYMSGRRPRRLLSSGNAKLMKSERTIGLSLAPAQTSGYQVCASSSVECRKHCIHTSGHGSPDFHAGDLPCNPVWVARALKTIWFFRDRVSFMDKLYRDIANNRDSSIRLNVFSDWMWERQSLTVSPEYAERYGTRSGSFKSVIELFPETQFYDYTKHFARMFRPRPSNYHLTFSLSEFNGTDAKKVLAAGGNIAAVTTAKEGYLFGYPVIDGDLNDLRFLDPKAVVVGLKPKGSLRNNFSEFVYEPSPLQRETQQRAA